MCCIKRFIFNLFCSKTKKEITYQMSNKAKIQERLININSEALNRLSKEQEDFILHSIDESCFLKACPGSGKTEVVGIKAAYEIANWKDSFAGIAVLSFTKNAAKEIADRVTVYDGINATKHPHYIGTIDSWLHNYIFHPFGHKVVSFQGRNEDKSFILVDGAEKHDFLHSYQTEHYSQQDKPDPIQVNKYYFNFKEDIESIKYNFNEFDKLKKENLKIKKHAFLKAGISTYQDAEFICYKVLKENNCILENLANRFPVIIVDECQDLSYSQLAIFHLLLKKDVKLFFIGDLNQAIYEFRKVYTENIEAFVLSNNIVSKELTQNYRSNQQIVNICQKLQHKLSNISIPSIKGNEKHALVECAIVWIYDNIEELPSKFINFIEQSNIKIKEKQAENGISEENLSCFINVQNSAILGRSHSLLSKIRPNTDNQLCKIGLFANALNCWNTDNRIGKDMQNALQQLGKSICILAYDGKGNYNHQYCPEGLNQIHWRLFLYEMLEESSKILYPFGEKTWSTWVSQLKSFLEGKWIDLPIEGHEWKSQNGKSVKDKIKSPTGEANNKVIETLKTKVSSNSNAIRLTTIHDIKGETLDAVLLISAKDKKSEGGYFEHWTDISEKNKKEYIRFAYVASSRPKHLLIWAIPKGKDFTELLNLGFKHDEK